ncbi:brisc and brca1-a complex member 2 [Anaeramoeba flamelloides]|uniref:BRISC and BRCA1-A complex member 2 n=1 Tax=Anaeramoeba flamelloides TaxID=1746091 RepID=A0ABQ8Y1V4_9EUKA|nr:brisc and brca1-a complex member 2 [Anaeramoeba flamelloides]
MDNQLHKHNIEPKYIKPFLESVLEYNSNNPSIQFIPKNFRSSSVSGIIDRFTIEFVHCTISNFSISVLFDVHRIKSPPDLILAEKEEFTILWLSLGSISKWDCSNKKSLLLVLQDLFGLYKNQQMNLFTTIKSNNLNEEYTSTFEIPGSEFCIRQKDLAVLFHIPIKKKKEYLLFTFESPYLTADISLYDQNGKELKYKKIPKWKLNSSILTIKRKYEEKNQFSSSHSITNDYTRLTNRHHPILKKYNLNNRLQSKFLTSTTDKQSTNQQYINKEKNYSVKEKTKNNYSSAYSGNSSTIFETVSQNNNINSKSDIYSSNNHRNNNNNNINNDFNHNNNLKTNFDNKTLNGYQQQQQEIQRWGKQQDKSRKQDELENFDIFKNKRKSFITKLIKFVGNPLEYDSISFRDIHFLIKKKKSENNFLLSFFLSQDFPNIRPTIKLAGLNYIKMNEEILSKPVRLLSWEKFINEDETIMDIKEQISNSVSDFEIYLKTQIQQKYKDIEEMSKYN